jgi:hypothetical protein
VSSRSQRVEVASRRRLRLPWTRPAAIAVVVLAIAAAACGSSSSSLPAAGTASPAAAASGFYQNFVRGNISSACDYAEPSEQSRCNSVFSSNRFTATVSNLDIGQTFTDGNQALVVFTFTQSCGSSGSSSATTCSPGNSNPSAGLPSLQTALSSSSGNDVVACVDVGGLWYVEFAAGGGTGASTGATGAGTGSTGTTGGAASSSLPAEGTGSPAAAVSGFIQNEAGGNSSSACDYVAPSEQSKCNSAFSEAHVTVTISNPGIGQTFTDGNQALVVFTTTNGCASTSVSGATPTSTCFSNSSPSAGLPSSDAGFGAALQAALSASDSTVVPCVDIGGLWYVELAAGGTGTTGSSGTTGNSSGDTGTT